MLIRWTLKQSKYKYINREGFQVADFARDVGTYPDNVDISLKDRRQKKQNYEKRKLTILTQQGQLYRRKFYQGWELHESIKKANNSRMKNIFEGVQGYILEEEKEEEEEYEIFEQLCKKQQNKYKNKYN